MKTTFVLPDLIVQRAKVAAAQRRTTVKALVIQGLETVLNDMSRQGPQDLSAAENKFLEIDRYGVPVLKRRNAKVTNRVIRKIRDQEGI